MNLVSFFLMIICFMIVYGIILFLLINMMMDAWYNDQRKQAVVLSIPFTLVVATYFIFLDEMFKLL